MVDFPPALSVISQVLWQSSNTLMYLSHGGPSLIRKLLLLINIFPKCHLAVRQLTFARSVDCYCHNKQRLR